MGLPESPTFFVASGGPDAAKTRGRGRHEQLSLNFQVCFAVTYSFNGIGLRRNLIYAFFTSRSVSAAEEVISIADTLSARCATELFRATSLNEEKQLMVEMTGSRHNAATSLPGKSVGDSLTIAFQKCGKFSARVRNRAWQVTNEQPLRILAILAAIAATAGAATRVWRSNQDE
jgi:hypothetical protein